MPPTALPPTANLSQRQHEFHQVVKLLRAQLAAMAATKPMLALDEQVAQRAVTAVVQVGGRSPDFDQRRSVEAVGLLVGTSRADVVRPPVAVQRRPMATAAADLLVVEQLPPPLGRRAEPAVDKVRAGLRPERFEIGVDGGSLLLGPIGEKNVARCPTARPPRRRCGRLPTWRAGSGGPTAGSWCSGVPLAVVQQVPIQAVGPAVRMTTGTTEPLLIAERRVVEQELAAPLRGQPRGRAQGDRGRRERRLWPPDRPPPPCR